MCATDSCPCIHISGVERGFEGGNSYSEHIVFYENETHLFIFSQLVTYNKHTYMQLLYDFEAELGSDSEAESGRFNKTKRSTATVEKCRTPSVSPTGSDKSSDLSR